MKCIMVVLVLLSIAGCASQQQAAQQASRNAEAQQEFARVRSYCQSLLTDSALSPIRSKVQLNAEIPPTFEMLANEEHVTPEERTAILAWANLSIQCQTEHSATQRLYLNPLLITLTSSVFASANALRAELYNGQLSYGQYNRERQKLAADYQAAWAQVNAELARQNADAQYRAQQIANQQWQNYLVLQQTVQQQQRAYQQQWQQQHGQVTCQQIGQFTYCNY